MKLVLLSVTAACCLLVASPQVAPPASPSPVPVPVSPSTTVPTTAATPAPTQQPQPHLTCTFESPCHWKWNATNQGFKVVTGQEVNNSWVPPQQQLDSSPPGPFTDADNQTHGHFLYLLVKRPGPKELLVWSPRYVRTGERCKLQFSLHMSNMVTGNFKVVIETSNHTSWVVAEKMGNNHKTWQNHTFNIGRVRQEFNIILEVTPSNRYPSHTAIDNINLKNCFPDPPQNVCSPTQFQCSNQACIDAHRVCDINIDCPDGEDEQQDCNKVPEFARCTFEQGWCGWHNGVNNNLNWTRNNGSTATTSTGPNFDHTYQNSTGMYLYVDMTGRSHDMGTPSELESPIINPPPKYHLNESSPYYGSCYITFYYHKFGPHSGSLGLFLIELQRNANTSVKLWWSYGGKGQEWFRQVVRLPNITNRYYFQFEARKSYSSRGDPAIDDISMSPKCFGIGVPKEHLDGYDYASGFSTFGPTPPPPTHSDFVNVTYYHFTTCGKTGMTGPSPENCSVAYNNTNTRVSVLTDRRVAGIQQWTVPAAGYYTIIARGASGGQGSDGVGSSWPYVVRTVVYLNHSQLLYILVGQEGNDACRKTFSSTQRTVCQTENDSNRKSRPFSKLHEIANISFLPEGGGGGGGTFVFTWPKGKEPKPLLVAAGGGGLGHGSQISNTDLHHGHRMNATLLPTTGDAYGQVPAGAGGGWKEGNYTYRDVTGLALLQGAIGGKACYISSDGSHKGAGGFGGGGGGCTAGGGGGGYTGGRASAQKSGMGEGGYSWIETGLHQHGWLSTRRGPGEVYIIPEISQGCGCDFRCVALDVYRSAVQCLCPSDWYLAENSTTCLMSKPPPQSIPKSFIIALSVACIFLLIIVTTMFTFLYQRYQRNKASDSRRKMLSGPDLQLNRLRVASDSMVTEYNPNYEFGGGTYSLRDLKEIPREHLRLVKALGQGAFGEVYQGFYKNRPGDAVEMPVAVKTLPELSTSQAETDFLMEALIMSKFNHPNIVHFIGVCFDKHPRFIVIELLAGGDLKTFLRESRPRFHHDRPSPLTMKDLLSCIVDVAKGCKYMEENRFIHRDIAARNCLLTTKGPGRVVKIADFGMARDIYRADYYRKGGKAMLPIKWMPPEAFLDGIFTSKTDVWSFGVLMWEVMSLGYMPYTGCANREVMQLVTSGGRLEPPTNCPSQLYAIMTQCWHPNPDERPNFALILERLGYCLQDPDVIKAPLPVYTRAPSSERDLTIMRPSSAHEDCLQPDYLVPLPGPVGASPSSVAGLDLLPPLWSHPQSPQPPAEFPASLSESRSTQPLLDGPTPCDGCSPLGMATPMTPQPLTPIPHNHNNNLLGSGAVGVMADSGKSPLLGATAITPTAQPVYIVSHHVKQDTQEITC